MGIQEVLDEGRLIRMAWSGTGRDGRQLLCLYTALAGDPNARPESCPADLAQQWVANLLPWINDAPSEDAWLGIVRRVAAIADRLHLLSPECEWRCRALCVRETMRHIDDSDVLAVCELAASLCERRGAGETVSESEMAAARKAAWEAAEAAWWEARAAARAAWADRLVSAIVEEWERDIRARG